MPFVSERPPAELRRTGGETGEWDGKEKTAQSNRERWKRKAHMSVCPEITFDTAPPVSMDLNQAPFFSEPKCIKPVEQIHCTAFIGAVPKFLFLPARIYLSGVQTGVKEEQIDTPSGSCLALAVCGTHDGFYREKTPKHKMAEVSKFRKSQKQERAADL